MRQNHKQTSVHFYKMIIANIGIVASMSAVFMSITSLDFLYEDGLIKNTRFALLLGMLSVVAAGSVAYFALRAKRQREHENKLRRAFIIYSAQDRERVVNLKKTFELAEIEPWIDFEKIVAGDVWQDTIHEAINESSMAIVLITESFTEDSYAYKELMSAIKTMGSADRVTSPIIPLVYQKKNLPDNLKHIQYVDMERPDSEEFLIKSLSVSMRRLWDAPNTITPS